MDKKLKSALNKVDELPDSWFGSESASFEDLPSVAAKKDVIRTSSYIRKDDLAYLKEKSKQTKVSVAALQGDIISAFVEMDKRKNLLEADDDESVSNG